MTDRTAREIADYLEPKAVDLEATPFKCDWAMARGFRQGSKRLLAATRLLEQETPPND